MAENVYCGPAPLPTTLWTSWNFDPFLLMALLGLTLGIAFTSTANRHTILALSGGAIALFVAFISPLCALATALFSARVAHHVLMIAVAAPLLALALSWRPPIPVPITILVLVHGVLVWLWHSPAPYTWAVSGISSYWLMELSLMLSAFCLWSAILVTDTRPGAALGALLGTIVQMGLLGAILTFARAPLFDFHAGNMTTPFGLTQLEDQQLAGLIMWVPAAIPYLIAAGVIMARLLPAEPREARERDA
jgi:putative membrane protein